VTRQIDSFVATLVRWRVRARALLRIDTTDKAALRDAESLPGHGASLPHSLIGMAALATPVK
jgi:hypothetical protein